MPKSPETGPGLRPGENYQGIRVTWTANAPSPTVSATLSSYTVTAGVDRVDLSWTSSNTDSCSYGGSPRAVNGTIANLGPFTAGTHNFTVSCTGKGGTTSDTATLTAERPPDPPMVTVGVNPDTITANAGTSTLSWSSTDATSCTRDGRTVATDGTASVGPYAQGSYDFTVSCTGPGGSANGSATLTVEPPPDPPRVTVRLNPDTIAADTGTSMLTWRSRNATSCTRDANTVAISGSVSVGPYSAGTRSFTVTCTGSGGSDSDTATLTMVPRPTVAISLSETTITAGEDTVDLTWSSTDAESCEYGSASLSNSGTRSIGPFTAGTHNISVSCTGVGGTGSASASLTAVEVPSQPDNDMDGIPDATDPDDDNDGMPDIWELENDFNPLSATDATSDADNDTHNNLAEFNAGSDPHWTLSKPDKLPEIFPGFNSNYTVQRGLINNDQLHDLLIRNPVTGIVPAVSDFVLIQQAAGGFLLEDASKHTIPSAKKLTSIDSVIQLYDLNSDGVTDLMLKGLDSHIEDAADQIVFSGYDHIYEVPGSHVAVDDTFKRFFSDLSAWIKDPDHFRKNVTLDAKIPISMQTDGLPTTVGYVTYGQVTITQAMLSSHLGKCIGLSPTLCFIVASDGLLGPLELSLLDELLLVARTTRQIAVYVEHDMQEKPGNLNVYDISRFDQEARLIAVAHLSQFRGSKSLTPGSDSAVIIAETLEDILGVEVFGGILERAHRGVITSRVDYCVTLGVACEILEVFDFILGTIKQVQIRCTSDDPDDCQELPVNIPDIKPADPDDKPEPTVDITKFGADALVISTAPAMPPATFIATVSGLSGSGYEIAYEWEAILYYEGIGKQRITQTKREGSNVISERTWGNKIHRFIRRIPTTGSASGLTSPDPFINNWTVPWGNILQGGDFTVIVRAKITSNGTAVATVSNLQTYRIVGSDPSLAETKAEIGDSVERLAVAWQESRHMQFKSDGTPLWGHPDGWGVMQIDNIPGVTRTVKHFWNWRENVKEGVKYIDEEIYPQALGWLKDRYNDNDPLFRSGGRTEGKDHDWGWSPYEISSDDSVGPRIWDDVFSRYNTGRHLYSPNGNGGMINCEASRGDRIYPNMRFDGCDYKLAVRCHVKSKTWINKSLDSICREFLKQKPKSEESE